MQLSFKSSAVTTLNCTFKIVPSPLPSPYLISLSSLRATRQAGAVYLKNRVYTSYLDLSSSSTPRPDQAPIPRSDRDALKANLLPLLAHSPSRSITVQLANTLKNVVARDFPESWPSLMDDVKRLLGSTDVRQVAAGCVASLEMIRAFRCVFSSSLVIRQWFTSGSLQLPSTIRHSS